MNSLSDTGIETQVAELWAKDDPYDERAGRLRELVDLLPERLRRTLLLFRGALVRREPRRPWRCPGSLRISGRLRRW